VGAADDVLVGGVVWVAVAIELVLELVAEVPAWLLPQPAMTRPTARAAAPSGLGRCLRAIKANDSKDSVGL
jgi:hypothetical protein